MNRVRDDRSPGALLRRRRVQLAVTLAGIATVGLMGVTAARAAPARLPLEPAPGLVLPAR